MLQTRETMQEFLLLAGGTGHEIRIAGGATLAPEFRKSELSEFRRAVQVFGVALVMDRQLFAGINAILRVSDEFLPDLGGSGVLAATFCHEGQIATRLGAKFGRQPGVERLCARGMRALGISAMLEKPR